MRLVSVALIDCVGSLFWPLYSQGLLETNNSVF
jgi:hypothetical protein